jgi:hypothetical protein
MLPSPTFRVSLVRSALLLLLIAATGETRSAPVPAAAEVSPRRALLITIHNYLFANPVSPGDDRPDGHGVRALADRLVKGKALRIPKRQILHFSDAVAAPPAPFKSTIEKTLRDFLARSSRRDRVLVLFAGHLVEVDEAAYLVPIEGQLDDVDTLIPLQEIFKEFAACKARQKVLILDVCHSNPSRGAERPAAGPLSPRLKKILKDPPNGVQVWVACSAGQHSYELGSTPGTGLFVDALCAALDRVGGAIPGPEEPLPLVPLVEEVNKHLRSRLKSLRREQTSRLYGAEQTATIPRDSREAPTPRPRIIEPAVPVKAADPNVVRTMLQEVRLPPVWSSAGPSLLRPELLPPYPADLLRAYAADDAPTGLRQTVVKAQLLLWALSAHDPPADIRDAVQKRRGEVPFAGPATLIETVQAPSGPAEQLFKRKLLEEGRKTARLLLLLEEELDELYQTGRHRDKASRRWQATYDFTLARIHNQIANLYEYSSALGSMRKEPPPRDPARHRGWRLAARQELFGDRASLKMASAARKLLDRLLREHAGTPWEVLARRERLTALGLEWVPEP